MIAEGWGGLTLRLKPRQIAQQAPLDIYARNELHGVDRLPRGPAGFHALQGDTGTSKAANDLLCGFGRLAEAAHLTAEFFHEVPIATHSRAALIALQEARTICKGTAGGGRSLSDRAALDGHHLRTFKQAVSSTAT